MKQGFVIPIYNHGKTVPALVKQLSETGLPVILVDDGSNEETKQYLNQTIKDFPLTVLVTLKKNSGKGGAISAGIDKALDLGLTHVLQIDADGQHDTGRCGFFLEQSEAHPEAMICAFPEYDESVPSIRKNGRVVANTWSKIVTLSNDIVDSMCGFRVYPVEVTHKIMHRNFIDSRMGFDIDILVRLHWNNISFLFFPVHVIYPEDGISNFHIVKDNIRISLVFTRLFFGMLLRLPVLLYRKIRKCNKNTNTTAG